MSACAAYVGSVYLVASTPDLLDHLVNAAVDDQLGDAARDYASGHETGLAAAITLLQAHRRGQAWPAWVTDAIAGRVSGWIGATTPAAGLSATRGRHARVSTRRRDDVCDAIRAAFVDGYLLRGLSRYAACRRVSRELSGTAAGSPKVIEAAHTRFHARRSAAKNRYASDVLRLYDHLVTTAYGTTERKGPTLKG